MIKPIAAITAAAVCAGLMASIAPEVAVGSSQSTESPAVGVARIVSSRDRGAATPIDGRTKREITCTQGWPYYEKACLNDSRHLTDKAHVVRMIAIDRLTNSGSLRARN